MELLDTLKQARMDVKRSLLAGAIAACARASPPRVETLLQLLTQVPDTQTCV